MKESLDKYKSYADSLKKDATVDYLTTVIKTTKNEELIQEGELQRS